MSQKVTTTEEYEYDSGGKLLRKKVTTVTEEYHPGWYTPYAPYTYPYITHSVTGTRTFTTGYTQPVLSNSDDDDGQSGAYA